MSLEVCNKLLTKREISKMIDDVYRGCGQKEIRHFLRQDHGLGFYNAFKAGISFGKDDMVIPGQPRRSWLPRPANWPRNMNSST